MRNEYINLVKTLLEKQEEKSLEEMPLPQDWDKEVFKDKNSFAKQIKYATDRALKVGTGSSRVAFVIPFENRKTVLKIAKNVKGLHQNQVEGDWGLRQMYPDVAIPLIDVDEENDLPRWIHEEFAEKLTKSIFKKLTGFNFELFGLALMIDEEQRSGKQKYYHRRVPPASEEYQAIISSELFEDISRMMGDFGILAGDLDRLANWGVYKGKPTIIDLGFTESTKTFYHQ